MTDKGFIHKLAGKLSRRKDQPEQPEEPDQPAETPKQAPPSEQPADQIAPQREPTQEPQTPREQTGEDYQAEPAKRPGVFKSSGKALAEAVDAQQKEVSELLEQVREMVDRTDRMLEESGSQQDLPQQIRRAVEQIGEQNSRLSESLEGIAEENRRQGETLKSVRTALQEQNNEQLTEQVQSVSSTLEEMKSSSAETAAMLKQVRDRLVGSYDELSSRLNRHASRLNRMMIGMFVALGVLVIALVMTIVLVW